MNYTPFSTFLLRSPLLPFGQLEDILKDKTTLLLKLSEVQIQEAIFLASPVLYSELQKLLKNEIKEVKEVDRILASLTRYISRMSTRCTPFGLFAGCYTGTFSDETNVEINNSISRVTRLDMLFLCTLYDQLIRNPEIRYSIKFYPNSSIYRIGKKFRYVEYQYISKQRKYQIIEVEQSNYLNNILKISKKGLDIKKLTISLVNNEITEKDASDYINELIDSQILIGELSQVVTGDDYFQQIINMLHRIGESTILPILEEIKALIDILDSQEKDNISIYKEIIKRIEKLNIPYEEKYLFQVDSVRKTRISQIGENIINELKYTMEFLNKITQYSENPTLSEFQKDFYNRYEDREVPLLEALDPEFGIGYPSKSHSGIFPLIDDMRLPSRSGRPSTTIDWFQSILLKKTIECLTNKKGEIILSDDDVKGITANWNDLPPTIYTMFEIIKAKGDNTLISLKSFGGSSAANLLGRFAHTDQNIQKLIKEITAKDQELIPNAVLTEIAYLPESRVGNILYRPHIRDYELLYMASSDLPPEQLIYLTDLTLSVKQGRLVIYSKRLKKEIVPRLTTAHNYRYNSMPAYRFLCDMQTQNKRGGLFFNWGQLANEFTFRPRVRYKNTILSPAIWSIKVDEMKHLLSIKDDYSLISEIDIWRKKYKLPQYVLIPDGDNELFVDWKNALSVYSLFSIIKKRQTITFSEFLFESQNTVVTNKENHYLNECIVAFYKEDLK